MDVTGRRALKPTSELQLWRHLKSLLVYITVEHQSLSYGETSRPAAHPTLTQYISLQSHLQTHWKTKNLILIHTSYPNSSHLGWERKNKYFISLLQIMFEQLLQNLERNTDMFTHTETLHNEQVTKPLFPNCTFIFPLYIGSDKASNASSLHLCTKSGNFWNTFAQMERTYFSWKRQMNRE